MMVDNPASTSPEDPRPRPQYGELAPEGWTWQPPQDAHAPAPAPGQRSATPFGAVPTRRTLASQVHQGEPSGEQRRGMAGPPEWDRPVTLTLVVIGLLATMFSISVLGALPEAIQMLYTQQDLGTYQPVASVAQVITAGSFAVALVWIATAAVSVLMLVKRRRSFYVPLIGAVVAVVVLFAFMAVVLATDPTLLNFYSRP